MFRVKKILPIILTVLIINAASVKENRAYSQTATRSSIAEKVKNNVAKFGTGEKSLVTARLLNKTNLKGYINEARENDFSLTDAKKGTVTAVAYDDVVQIKKQGLSRKAKILIGIAVGVAAYVAVIAVITKGGTRRVLD